MGTASAPLRVLGRAGLSPACPDPGTFLSPTLLVWGRRGSNRKGPRDHMSQKTSRSNPGSMHFKQETPASGHCSHSHVDDST